MTHHLIAVSASHSQLEAFAQKPFVAAILDDNPPTSQIIVKYKSGVALLPDSSSHMADVQTAAETGMAYARDISAGAGHTCALLNTGGVKCCGDNRYGQLGIGNTTDSSVPVDVIGLTSGVSAISVSPMSSHMCALMNTGGVKCWGDNRLGALGNGNTTDSSVPIDVSGLTSNVIAISVGGTHTCALLNTSRLKCWGANGYGQLGAGNITDSSVPVDVLGLTNNVSAISAGGNHTCALLNTGGLKCWGHNFDGELGNGGTGDSFVPVDVVGLSSGVKVISAGAGHTCALLNTGGLKCWGHNSGGQLGTGNTSRSSVPIGVVGLTNGVSAISAGWGHTCAILNTSGVKCWGYNSGGQLGNGNITNSSVPVDVFGLTSGVSAIGVGGGHTCAILNTSGVKCWGLNLYGQLGNGNTMLSYLPVDVVDNILMRLRVGNGSGSLGSKGNVVSMTLENLSGINIIASGLQFNLAYSMTYGAKLADLRTTSRTKGAKVISNTVRSSEVATTTVLLYFENGSNIAAGTGSIIDLLFDVNITGTAGINVPLNFSDIVLVSSLGSSIPFDFANLNPLFNISALRRGDINSDMKVDVLDLMVLRSMVLNPQRPQTALYPLEFWQRADLNKDEVWNILDIVQLIPIILKPSTLAFSKNALEEKVFHRYEDVTVTNTLHLAKVTAPLSSKGTLTATLTNSDAMAALQLDLAYDASSGVKLTGVRKSSRVAEFEPPGWAEDLSDPSIARVKVLLYDLSGNNLPAGEGEVLLIDYEVMANANRSSAVEVVALVLSDPKGAALTTQFEAGYIAIGEDPRDTPQQRMPRVVVPLAWGGQQ